MNRAKALDSDLVRCYRQHGYALCRVWSAPKSNRLRYQFEAMLIET